MTSEARVMVLCSVFTADPIVHILQSIDGRISGSFFMRAMPYVADYAEIRHGLTGDAMMYGATTARELFAKPRPNLSEFEGGVRPCR